MAKVEVESVNYYCPSNTFIYLEYSWQDRILITCNAFKQDLIIRKNSKILVYNTVDSLIDQVHIMFPGSNIKI